jgi:glycosyltransferase involved in cell wall biosynthesis
MTTSTGKVDFHLHSYASNVTDYYTANLLAIPESYSDPIENYRLLAERGMTLFTLTDHNSIDGVREMLDAGLPGVFISAEMTATFPEDGCNIHVTVANMTEAQFAEVNRLRSNVYDMCDYLEREIASEASAPAKNRLVYFMTHPLMSTQNRPYGREGSLKVEHIEKALVLFNTLEVRNGSRTRALNELTHRLVTSLDQATIERLANEHGIAPRGPTPWLKGVTGGSDDHAGINPGRTWTEFPHPALRAPTANDLVDALRRRETAPAGEHGGPINLAHAMVKLLYDGTRSKHRKSTQKAVSFGGPIQSLLRFVFDSESVGLAEKVAFQLKLWTDKLLTLVAPGLLANQSFEDLLAAEARTLLVDEAFRVKLAGEKRTDDRIFLVVNTLVNRMFQRYAKRLAAANSSNLVGAIKDAVALVSSSLFFQLPYLISYTVQSSDNIVRDVHKRFDLAQKPRLVLVTDTFFEINGVAGTIRKMIVEARRRGIDFTVVTCLDDAERAELCKAPEFQRALEAGELVILPSIAQMDVPGYSILKLRVPSFLELLQFLQEKGFTKMQVSTPGTVGLAGLFAAKLLQIETSSTYHTSLPEYVENYTRDVSLEALCWNYMIAFYHSVDEVVVPSKFIAKLLHARGLRNRKLLILDRWVDIERFHPSKRTKGFYERFGLADDPEVVRFIYVGRLGVEKNLAVAAEAYKKLLATHRNVHFLIVGDGPNRADLEKRFEGTPCTFTGFLSGEELSQAFASADVLVFPSTTDTWGNTVLEAQASGLPVIVTNKGGPQELMIDGETGVVVNGPADSVLAAMRTLMDRETRLSMAARARSFVEENRVDAPFSAIFESELYRQRVKAAKKLAQAALAEPEVTRVEDEPIEAYLVDHRMGLPAGARLR